MASHMTQSQPGPRQLLSRVEDSLTAAAESAQLLLLLMVAVMNCYHVTVVVDVLQSNSYMHTMTTLLS